MGKEITGNKGIKLLVKKYREKFRTSENLNYYSKEDYKTAERKFLKSVLCEEQT
jgi:hypothetical protein